MNGIVYPHDVDLERSVLGSQLLTRDAAAIAAEMGADASLYYSQQHQDIQAAILAVFDRGDTPDMITVTQELRHTGALERCAGLSVLIEVATCADPGRWIEMLQDYSARRALIDAGTSIARDASRDDYDGDIRAEATNRVLAVSEGREATKAAEVGAILPQVFADLEAAQKGVLQGIPTGMTDVDARTGGLHPGELIVIAGRPGMGKTALALAIASNIGREHCGVVFSIEMGRKSLVQRLLSAEAKLSLQGIRNGWFKERDLAKLSGAASAIDKLQISIDDTPGASLTHVRATCMRLKPRWVMIDYIQLMSTTARISASRQQAIGEVTRGLKVLARDLDAPIVALSQLSRIVEHRKPYPRPQLSDLRESGDIEQDADIVMFCYRPEYYGYTSDDRTENSGLPVRNRAEIIIGKQRNGPTGIVDLRWVPEYAGFNDWASDETSNEW